MKRLLHFPAKKNVAVYRLPSGVENISYYSITYNQFLKHLIFPDSVKAILEYAFLQTKSLEYMTAFRNYHKKEIAIDPKAFEGANIQGSSMYYVYSSLKPITCQAKFSFDFRNIFPFIVITL